MMEIFAHMAHLFSYPKDTYRKTIAELQAGLKSFGHKTMTSFLPVAEHFTSKPLAELQEYYIRTFDVNATCYLDIGYVLFGEKSKRG